MRKNIRNIRNTGEESFTFRIDFITALMRLTDIILSDQLWQRVKCARLNRHCSALLQRSATELTVREDRLKRRSLSANDSPEFDYNESVCRARDSLITSRLHVTQHAVLL